MAEIRAYAPRDLNALYDIALKTGDSGQDATELLKDPKLVGHIYAAPYAVLCRECSFVVEDEIGVGGYIVGALDTSAFAVRCEAEWWPTLRVRYREPDGVPGPDWDPESHYAWLIHHPQFGSRKVIDAYPSHLHINLLPRMQGRDLGRRLITHWIQTVREIGSMGVHFGVSVANHRALKFYRQFGFTELAQENPVPVRVFAMVL